MIELHEVVGGSHVLATGPKQTPAKFHFSTMSCCGHLRTESRSAWREPRPLPKGSHGAFLTVSTRKETHKVQLYWVWFM